MHEERQARAGAGRRPFEHLEIAVGMGHRPMRLWTPNGVPYD